MIHFSLGARLEPKQGFGTGGRGEADGEGRLNVTNERTVSLTVGKTFRNFVAR